MITDLRQFQNGVKFLSMNHNWTPRKNTLLKQVCDMKVGREATVAAKEATLASAIGMEEKELTLPNQHDPPHCQALWRRQNFH